MPRYVQAAPEVPDPYASDAVAQSYIDRYVPADAAGAAHARLAALGADIETTLRAAHPDAETHPPMLRQYDAWGRRVDRVETAAGWETQRVAAAGTPSSRCPTCPTSGPVTAPRPASSSTRCCTSTAPSRRPSPARWR